MQAISCPTCQRMTYGDLAENYSVACSVDVLRWDFDGRAWSIAETRPGCGTRLYSCPACGNRKATERDGLIVCPCGGSRPLTDASRAANGRPHVRAVARPGPPTTPDDFRALPMPEFRPGVEIGCAPEPRQIQPKTQKQSPKPGRNRGRLASRNP